MFFTLIKRITITLSFLGSCVVAHEPLNQATWFTETVALIGQSNFVYACSKNIQTKIDKLTTSQMFNLGDEPASEKYQELGSQAQFAVGIPLERHLPIKKINPTSPVAHLFGALAESNAIYVNEERFEKVTYGAARCALYHEAVHVKYNDKVVDGMIEAFMLIVGSIGFFYVLKAFDIRMLRKTVSFVFGLGMASHASNEYHHFMERRADIEGHYATQCSCCVREHAQRRYQLFEVENNLLKDSGYLWSADLEKIAQDLGDKRCSFHSPVVEQAQNGEVVNDDASDLGSH